MRTVYEGKTAFIVCMAESIGYDPADVPGSGRAITPALAAVVRHCLEKNPEEGFQSARDLSFALQAASSASTSSRASPEQAQDQTSGTRC
jgi:hypothetical protein